MVPSVLIIRPLSAQAAGEPQTFSASFTVGRSPTSDVQIIHPLVSRTHLLLTPTPAGWHVACQGRNGMLVNGMVTREAMITQGTRIQLGDASGPALGLTPAQATPPSSQPFGAPPGGQWAGAHPAGTTSQAPAARGPEAANRAGVPALPADAPAAVPAAAPGTSPATRAPNPVRAGGPPATPHPGIRSLAPKPVQPEQTQPEPMQTVVAPQGSPSLEPSSPSSSPGAAAFPSSQHTVEAFRITSSGTIGRAPDNALVLNDPLVSKHHARIDLTPQGMVVTDLGSTNGIYLSGQRVPQVAVNQPVVIGMGSTFVSIRPDGLCEIQVAGASSGELVGKDLTFRATAPTCVH